MNKKLQIKRLVNYLLLSSLKLLSPETAVKYCRDKKEQAISTDDGQKTNSFNLSRLQDSHTERKTIYSVYHLEYSENKMILTIA